MDNALLADNDQALSPRFIQSDGLGGKPGRDELFFPDVQPTAVGCEKIAENVFKTFKQAGIIEALKSDRPV